MLASEPTRFLSTVQMGITLIGILAGAFGGATISEHIAALLNKIAFIHPYGETVSLIMVVAVITYLSVVFGEIIPKRLALTHPEQISLFVSNPMMFLSKVASPIVNFLSFSTEKFIKILGIKESFKQDVTDEEVLVLLEQGRLAGTFEEVEQSMVDNVFNLSDQQISYLMTPRPQIVWIDIENSIEENIRIITESIHSTFPVCRNGLEDIIGVVQVKNLLAKSIAKESIDLSALITPPLFVPETIKVFKALEMFKESGKQFALITDEYGIVQGVVTLTDVLESIVGDIPNTRERANPQAVQRDDGTWLLDGIIAIDDFKEICGIDSLPGEDTGSYQTLGGFVLMQMEKIPDVADYFIWDKFRIEVVDMDGNRVDKVLLSENRSL